MRGRAPLYGLMGLFLTINSCHADDEICETPSLHTHVIAATQQVLDAHDESALKQQHLDQVDEVLTLWMHRLSYLARTCTRLVDDFKWPHSHPLMRYVHEPLIKKENALFHLRQQIRYTSHSQTTEQVDDLMDAERLGSYVLISNCLFGSSFLSLDQSSFFSKQDLDKSLSLWIDTLEERSRQSHKGVLRGVPTYAKDTHLALIGLLQGLWLLRDEIRYAGPILPFPFLSQQF